MRQLIATLLALACPVLLLVPLGCGSSEGREDIYELEAEELGGSPDNPAPGQFPTGAPGESARQALESGADPDR